MKTRMWLVGALIALCAAGAMAQGVSIGPIVGYNKSRDADDGKILGGGAVRLRLMPGLGVEGAVGYRQEDYANGGVHVKSWPVMVTGLIYPLPVVYGAIGAGWYNTSVDYDAAKFPGIPGDTKQQVGWHFGAGVELPAGSTRITGDIRYVFLNYNFNSVPGRDINSDFYVATVGLLFDL